MILKPASGKQRDSPSGEAYFGILQDRKLEPMESPWQPDEVDKSTRSASFLELSRSERRDSYTKLP